MVRVKQSPRTSPALRRAREQFALRITSIPTAACREHSVIQAIEEWVSARKDRIILRRDRHGNLIIGRRGYDGSRRKKPKPIMITAHLDHPAFVVRTVRGSGRQTLLDLEFRGGVHDPYFVGSKIEVFNLDNTKSVDATIVSLDAKVRPPSTPFKRVVARLRNPAARALIAPRCIARWKLPKATIARGILSTHACDDLAAVAAALIAFDSISRDPALSHVKLLFTRSEEIGFVGAIGAARCGTIPKGTRLICLENSRSYPHDSPIGAGPIVRVGDKLSVFTPTLTNLVSQIAASYAERNKNFHYQRKLMPGGVCEATTFSTFGYAATCICLPLGNYHNMQKIDEVLAGKAKARIGHEQIATRDFHALVEFLEVIARELDEASAADSLQALMDTRWVTHSRLLQEG